MLGEVRFPRLMDFFLLPTPHRGFSNFSTTVVTRRAKGPGERERAGVTQFGRLRDPRVLEQPPVPYGELHPATHARRGEKKEWKQARRGSVKKEKKV